ncbi:MAG: flagellar basal-body rod protein FlgF [Planctomycetales bacterium]|nr:flagellar basal-body rod protein FlgF [Planctomycetales bacterium]
MPYGMYISAEGAQAQAKRMEVIANNLANVNTPGYKRDVATFQARFAEAIDQGVVTPGDGGQEDLGGGVMTHGVRTDFSLGALQHTGIETDMVIAGEGFFQIATDRGNMLTRAGNFTLSPTGQLETQSGDLVLGAGGGPITIDPTLGPWQVNGEGAIEQAGVITPLAIVRPRSLGDLVKVGENLFSPLGDVAPVPQAERKVRSGFLEMSGTNATTSMMEMIETSRAFEANMKLIQNQDHVMGQLIGRVLGS